LVKNFWKTGKICAKQTGKSMQIGTDTLLFVLKSLEMIQHGRQSDRPPGKNV
jgi:hypothetical protein